MSEPPTEQQTPMIEELPHRRLILVICRYRYFKQIKEECEDWQSEGLHIIASGTTHRAYDGFLLCECRDQPIPRLFMKKLKEDADIFDYIPINVRVMSP